jgi:hypothetical protein
MEFVFALAFSHHMGLEGNYNEIHPHVQLQHDSGFVAGAYLNSETRLSAYAGYRFEHGPAFLEMGAVTGYQGIAVAPYVRAGYEVSDGVDVFVAPALERTRSGDPRVGAVLGISFDIN